MGIFTTSAELDVMECWMFNVLYSDLYELLHCDRIAFLHIASEISFRVTHDNLEAMCDVVAPELS